MKKVALRIDGKNVVTDKGTTVLQAALDNRIYIPHLCSQKDLFPAGACRMCMVRIKENGELVAACSTKVCEGMEIDSMDKEALSIRRLSCELLFKRHPTDCTGCPKYGKCQLQSISQYIGMGRELRCEPLKISPDSSNPVIMYEMNRCILCGKCIRACNELRGVGAIHFEKLDGRTRVVVSGSDLINADCKFCTACVEVCPTGAIHEQPAIMDKLAGKSREEAYIPCKAACPAHIDVPKYLRFIREGNYEAASAVIHEKAQFPESLGYICVHNCEADCKRNNLNEPVSIRDLKRFAEQNGDESWKKGLKKSGPSGKRVAIVGAGPAGMTCADVLSLKGHKVTVFEARPEAGGQLRYGIPEYRLPKTVVTKEISNILANGAELITGKEIRSVQELRDEDDDAIFVATGTHKGIKLPIDGAQLPEVYVNTEFLADTAAGNNPPIGKRVMVLGGGNVAIDCAGVAKRLGAQKVYMACLESYNNMTASPEERTWAQEEGIELLNSRTFLGIVGEQHVQGMRVAAITGFHFDEHGKSIVDLVPDGEEVIEADTVIFAIGQRSGLPEDFGVEMSLGRPIVNGEGACSVQGVFAAGDAVTGTKSVIQAIANARIAASAIDKYLGGDGDISQQLSPEQKPNPYIGKQKGFNQTHREETRTLLPEFRSTCFDVMDLGLDEKRAVCEAGRCLQCDLRLQLEPQRFWNDYMD